MSTREPTPIPELLVINAEDRAALERSWRGHAEPVDARRRGAPRRATIGRNAWPVSVVVVARWDAPGRDAAVKACFAAAEAMGGRAPRSTLLVRRGPARCEWPDHPVSAVLDVDEAEWEQTLALLARALVRPGRALRAPFYDDRFAQVVLVRSQQPPDVLERRLTREVRGPFVLLGDASEGEREEEQEPAQALVFQLVRERPRPCVRHPLLHGVLAPRAWVPRVEAPEDDETIACDIASLHVLHGDWELTRALVERLSPVPPAGYAAGERPLVDMVLEWLGWPPADLGGGFAAVLAMASEEARGECGRRR